MLFKGDKIKQVKTMVGFNYVGSKFNIVQIDGELIVFENHMGRGMMNMKEFEQYFEKVVEGEWSDWQKKDFYMEYRTKGNTIQCKFRDGIITHARCLDEDEFNLKTGLDICELKHQKMLIEKSKKSNEKLIKCYNRRLESIGRKGTWFNNTLDNENIK